MAGIEKSCKESLPYSHLQPLLQAHLPDSPLASGNSLNLKRKGWQRPFTIVCHDQMRSSCEYMLETGSLAVIQLVQHRT